MPISVILLGVFIIFLAFRVGKQTFEQFKVSTTALRAISLLAFILLLLKPITIYNTVYISLGGFFVFTLFALYLLIFTKNKQNLYLITSGFFVAIALCFLFNLFFPFMQEQLFEYTTIFTALVLGLVIFALSKNLKNAFIIIFLALPTSSVLQFIVLRSTDPGNMLFLGTGNFFEISVIAFSLSYLLIALKNINFFKKTKEQSYENKFN